MRAQHSSTQLAVWLATLAVQACSSAEDAPSIGNGGTSAAVGMGGSSQQATDPLSAAPTCSSKISWTRGENAQMRPGEACISCHTANGGPRFSIAGTVYATGHEPNDCNGVPSSSGALVLITDAENREYRVSPNVAGNFYLEQSIALPYRAKVTSGKGERVMISAQSSGDCNGCHTQSGANSAPGRITLPW